MVRQEAGLLERAVSQSLMLSLGWEKGGQCRQRGVNRPQGVERLEGSVGHGLQHEGAWREDVRGGLG